jgi:hypothetical protein
LGVCGLISGLLVFLFSFFSLPNAVDMVDLTKT